MESTNIPDINIGMLAESIKWTVNAAKQEVVTKVVVRQGVRFALDPNSEASRLANGRQVSADDVLFCMNEFFANPDSQHAKLFPQNRDYKVVKTGPWELTLTLPFKDHLAASMRVLGLTIIYPPEVYAKYKSAFSDPKNDVGTGPYMISDYVVGSMVSLKRNPNYWMKNPVGPGKGDQLAVYRQCEVLRYPGHIDTGSRTPVGEAGPAGWFYAGSRRRHGEASSRVEADAGGDLERLPDVYENGPRPLQ